MHYITAADGSRQPIFLVVLGNLFILNVIFISLRLYCRIRHIGEAGKDDYCILAAFLIAVGMNVQSVVHVTYGTGTHIDTIPRENFVTIHKHWYAYQLIYPLALCLVKQSILILYYRIFIHQNLRTWIKVVACFVLLDTVITEIVNIFECSHPSRAWDVDEFPRGCINLEAAYFARSGTAILTDLVIMILPMPVLAKLQIPKRRRVAVIGIFLIGSLSLCASIARLIAIHDWSVSNDPSYTAIWILLWSHIEVQVAICTACAITLRPIFRKVSSLSDSTSPTPTTYYYTTSSRSRSTKSSQQPVLTGAGGGGGGLLSLATPVSSSGSQCRRRSSTTMGAEALNVVAMSEVGGKATREAQRESVVGLEVRVVDGLGDGGKFE
ncbi:hypothetical protein IWZ03DRAFT_384102 [Phyllosticta citriasiana]|uniref:Rhodopsin domain-containing protein n=1 Tax=Phyllosticta citriasiana TaxID=595635 RepID=A0ABR1KDE5_9PEZI